MAKKKKKNDVSVKSKVEIPESLPQNMVMVGEQSEYDKKVYISQKTYNEIHKFTKNKTTNEAGGVLVGKIIEEFGKINILIYAFVEAKHCEATPTTLTFTHETWDDIHKQIDSKFPGGTIVGWIHTHPNYGIFLSEYDKFIQNNFFNDENQIAYVIDPIQNIEGFYLWINGNIENSKCFFVYDKNGSTIELKINEEKKDDKPESMVSSARTNIIIAIMAVVIVILSIFCVVLKSNVDQLKSNQESIENIAKANIINVQNEIFSLHNEVQSLRNIVDPTEKETKNEDTSDKSDGGTNVDFESESATEENTDE